MHQYKIVAQFSLILSILNLILAAPIRVDGTVVAEDVAAMPNEHAGEAASDRSASLPSIQDAMGSPQHSSSLDGSTFSGYYPTPPLSSSEESVSGYAWLLHRPQRMNLNPPASLASPHLSSPGFDESVPDYAWLLNRPPRLTLNPPPSLASAHLSHPWPSEMTLPWRLQGSVPEHPPSPQSAASPEIPYLSASGGSLSSHYFSASDGLPSSSHSILEGLAPSHHLISDGSPPSPPPPPTGTPPDSAEFLNKDVVRKLKIVAGVIVVGSIITTAIAGIVGSQFEQRDFQDS